MFKTQYPNCYASTSNIRSQAVLQLGNNDDVDAIPTLVDVLLHDESLNVQEDATWALVAIGKSHGDQVANALIDVLQDRNANFRHNAVHTLGKLKHPSSLDALITCLDDTDSRVRIKSAVALEQLNDEQAVPALIAQLATDDMEFYSTLMNTLGNLASCDALQDGLTSEHASVREGIVSLLGERCLPDLHRYILPLLRDPDVKVRLATLQALQGTPRNILEEYLPDLLTDENNHVRIMTRVFFGE